MTPISLEQRRERLRLPVNELARRASVDKYTASRFLAGHVDTRSSKADAIRTAIEGEELAVLAHLARLHPQAAIESAQVVTSAPRAA